MLLDDFFMIDKMNPTADGCDFSVSLCASHKVYEGHFPEKPVVPGVCSVQMVKECAERYLSCHTRIQVMDNCKFSAMIIPTMTPHLDIKLIVTKGEEEYKLKATITASDVTFLTLKATLVKEN